MDHAAAGGASRGPIELAGSIAILAADGAIHLVETSAGRMISKLQAKRGVAGAGGLARAAEFLAAASGRTLQLIDPATLYPER